ncbi:hypothetical protein BDZ89DRAFT_1006661 [Hymenopellis radicata]|nr:hypothetical protein BDZ89DRAFT_1006661 [Hymenopellis radicata]
MDPFEVRMQFLNLLRRLNATQQSIQKVVAFAVKYFKPCGEDLWDCIVEECQKGSINSRINILYCLDSLCEMSLLVKSHSNTTAHPSGNNQYLDFVARDIGKIVENVVPPGREGLPNLVSTRQILESWKAKRTIDPQIIDQILALLSTRKQQRNDKEKDKEKDPSRKRSAHLPRHEIFKRIEEDRERHKRLRERRWVQPISYNVPASQQLLTFMPFTERGDGEFELSIDVEFDNEWEATSDWNEDDEEACAEENALCFA